MEQSMIKKNILDLKYNKNLQYLNTTIISLITLFIGVSIAFLTGQVNPNLQEIIPISLITGLFASICIILLLKFNNEMKNIEKEILNLQI